jgi:hypothetical protein
MAAKLKVLPVNPFQGDRMAFKYNDKHREGVVELVRYSEAKGYLLTMRHDDGSCRSYWLGKVQLFKKPVQDMLT